ncbi:hypothetical protein [Rhizobium sp. G21]|uniref:hypothetical protein n=1 Tax=Rhizobium sp. G21 TaxID=2758439 RepID=UPI001600D292|nr:hypothetical protein [Rhizobium sp. G21]MBB1247462.1 hypothetical protein [Rhizobium sp. G21]
MTTLLYTQAEFFRRIRFAERPFFNLLPYRRESMDGGGNAIGNRRGQPKWTFTVRTAGGRHDADLEIAAQCRALIGRNAGFLAYDLRRPWPAADPGGDTVSGYGGTIRVNAKGSDNRSLSLKNMPIAPLSVGDMIAVKNDDGYRQILSVAEAAGVNSSDTTSLFQVQPFLPSWVQVNDEVTLFRASMMFRILADSFSPPTGSGNTSGGLSFTAISVSR